MISSKALGLLFLFITSAAWIGASFITQALVSRGEQQQAALEPWLLTLICSSTLMLYLPIGHCARKRARYEGRVARAARSPKPRTRQRKGPVGTLDDVALEHAGCVLPRRRNAAASAVVDSTALDGADDLSDDDGGGEGVDAEVGGLGRGSSTAARVGRGGERLPLLHTHKHPLHGVVGGGDAAVAVVAASVAGGEVDAAEGAGGEGGEVDTMQIVRAALMVAPIWFAAQLAFTASLEYTSVTSNTVLSSCSSLFVYIGSLALGQEVSSALRFASVVAAMAGTTLVAMGDKRDEGGSSSSSGGGGGGGASGAGGSNPLFGDALTLCAAALYAIYTLMMKKLLVKDDAIVMALFFGTIGVVYFSVLVPVAGTLALAGASVVRRVTGRALGLALVQGLIDYVAADYAWARAVMLLGPTATSCGLAMQIPAAGIIDALLNGSRLSWSESPGSLVQFIFGSLLIICGFVGVSLDPRVAAAIWKRCSDCGRTGSSSSSAVGIGGSVDRLKPGGGGSRSGGGTATDLRADGRPPPLVWDAARGSGTAAEVETGGASGSSGEQHAARGSLLGELEARRGRRVSAGGGGSRGAGLGGSAGSGSTVDLQSYIPLSSTAGAVTVARGVCQ